MNQWLWNIFEYDSTPVIFESAYGLDESVRRLAAERNVSSTLTYADGKVTAQAVVLHREVPLAAPAVNPYFYGKFQIDGDKVQLIGSFSLHRLARVIIPIYIWFLIFWKIFSLIMIISTHQWWMPLFGIGLFIIILGALLLAKWFTRGDIAWLTQVIEKALGITEFSPPSE